MKTSYLLTISGMVLMLPRIDALAQVATVDLGTADNFGVLGGAGVTNTGPTTITGDVGVSPGTSITGFPPGSVTGTVYNNDAVAAQAQIDLTTAYVDAAGRPATMTSADLSGSNLVSGVYSNPALGLSAGALILDGQGNPDSVWIFQSGSSLIIANDTSIVLINGAQACMIFWQVTSSATIGTNASFQGTVLALSSITVNTGASVVGRLLAQNGAVTLDTNTIVAAICAEVIADTETETDTAGGEGTTTSGGTGKATETSNAALVEQLKKALIVAAKVDTLDSLPGLTSIYSQGFSQFDTQVFSLRQRFADLRAGARAAGGPGHWESGVSSSRGGGVQNTSNRDPFPSGKNPVIGMNPWGEKNPAYGNGSRVPDELDFAGDNRWGFFINGTGDYASSSNMHGGDGASVGTCLGIDYWLTENLVAGVSVSYSHSENDLSNDSNIESDGGKASLYAMYQNGPFFAEGLAGGGYNSYDITRAAYLGDARGDTHGEQLDAYLGIGYGLEWRGWTVTPMASLLYTRVGIDGYNEVGSLLPLKIDSQHASSLRSRVGPGVSYTGYWGDTRIIPSFSAQWQHEFFDDDLPFEGRFADGSGDPFTVYSPNVGSDSLLLTAAVNIAWKNYAAYLAYQANLGLHNYESHSALVGLRVSW